jgi:biopolymer transport protein ExbD
MRLLLVAVLVACGSAKPPPEPITPVALEPPATKTVSPEIELPEVAITGFDRADQARPQIAVSSTALTVKGKHVLALTQGNVATTDIHTGATGTTIPKLREHTSALGTAGVLLQLDRRTPFSTLLQIMSTLQATDVLSVAIMARAGAHTLSAPIALPPKGQNAWVRHTVPPDGAPSPHVQPAIALSSSELRLFSISGTAGTREKPALVIKMTPVIDFVALGRKLADVRKRHPDPTDLTMVVVADGTLPIQTVLEVIAVVRATPEGKALYPEIVLSTGGQ